MRDWIRLGDKLYPKNSISYVEVWQDGVNDYQVRVQLGAADFVLFDGLTYQEALDASEEFVKNEL